MTPPSWATSIEEALRAFGLADRHRAARRISLSENATYLVDLDEGEKVVVRLHRPGFRSREEIVSELRWIDALRSDDVVLTPPIWRTPEGEALATFRNSADEDQHAVVFGFAEGESPDAEKPGALSENFTELGALTARLHAHAASWPLPEGFTRMTWTVDGAIGPDSGWEPWRANSEIDHGAHEVLGAVETKLRRELAAYGRIEGKTALLHGDLRTTNLLVAPSGTTVIDFDDCGFGWLMWDLACALSFIEADPAVPRLVDAWIEGYTRHAPVDDDDLAALPALVMLRRLLLVGWMISRAGTAEHARMIGRYVPDSVRIGRAFLADSFLAPLGGPHRR